MNHGLPNTCGMCVCGYGRVHGCTYVHVHVCVHVCTVCRSIAIANNLIYDQVKSREMLVNRRGSVEKTSQQEGIERVESLRIPGMTLGNTLSVTRNVDALVCTCSGSQHSLDILRSHSPREWRCTSDNVAAEATVASRLT